MESAEEQTRAHQEHQGECHLSRDQGAAKTEASRDHAAGVLFQNMVGRNAGGAQGGSQAEQESGEYGDSHGEGQYTQVGRCIELQRAAGLERKRTSRRLPHTANSKPPRAPSAESSRLSDMSWRMTRRRAAPMAMRMEISRWRAAARASSRLAILAQEMTSTRPTTTINVKSAVLYRLPVSEKPVGGRA